MLKLTLTLDQLEYALVGMGFHDHTIELLKEVLIDGKKPVDVAHANGIARQALNTAIRRLEENLLERLEADGMEPYLVFGLKSQEDKLRNQEVKVLKSVMPQNQERRLRGALIK